MPRPRKRPQFLRWMTAWLPCAGLIEGVGNLFYKVGPRDPLAFGSAFVILMIAALASCFLPA